MCTAQARGLPPALGWPRRVVWVGRPPVGCASLTRSGPFVAGPRGFAPLTMTSAPTPGPGPGTGPGLEVDSGAGLAGDPDAARVKYGPFPKPLAREDGPDPMGEWGQLEGAAVDPNSRYQGDFMIPLAPVEDAARKAAQGDTSHMFEDSQNDLAAFPKTDTDKARQASNRRAIDHQRTGTGRTGADTAPSRFVGANTCSWATRNTAPLRRLASEAVPFGSSLHLETSRLM